MKKILIVNNNMHIGGVQKALASLLWNIRERYDVTLLLFYAGGEGLTDIPPEVKVQTVESAYRYLGMTRRDCKSPKDTLLRSFYAALCRILGRKYAVALMGLGQKKLQGFDAAISYLHNAGDKAFYGGCNDFVLKHVSASKKIAFLHCDYMRCGANTADNKRMYARFDLLAACSQGCADSFLQANPSLRDRVRAVPNCHRFEDIEALARKAPVTLQEGKINVVTVARLGKEKGVERALRAIARLGEAKNTLHYYIIGDGIQKELLLEIIQKESLEDVVTLCGMLPNPYGYIKTADLLLIPSYSEAAPLVIGEAACLGTPILSMKTSSAEEMISDYGYGWVCENTEEDLTESLKGLINTPQLLKQQREKVESVSVSNHAAVVMFDGLINEIS